MSETTKDIVMRAVAEVFKPQTSPVLSEIVKKPDFGFKELTDSSLLFVEFCMAVEESLGVEIEFDDLMTHSTLSTFVDWLEQQLEAG